MASDSTVARLRFDTVIGLDGMRSGMKQAAEIARGGMGRIGAAMSSSGGFGAFQSLAGRAGISMPSLGGMIGGGALGIAGAGAGLFGMAQSGAAHARELSSSAEKVGLNIEQYQELSHAARKSGAGVEEAAGALNHLRRNTFEATNGNKAMADTFASMGINAKEVRQQDAGQQLETVAKGLMQIKDTTQRAAYEMQLFGKSGAQLEPMLRGIAVNGLAHYKSFVDMTEREAAQLKALTVGVPNIGEKIFSHFMDALAPDPLSKGIDITSAIGGKAKPASNDSSLTGFGDLAQRGSQEAYSATIAWQYGLVDKQQQQVDLLTRIADGIDKGAGD